MGSFRQLSQIDSLHSCPILPWNVESIEERAWGTDESVCRHLLQAHTVDAPKRSAARNRSTCGDTGRGGLGVTVIGRVGCARPRCRGLG